MKIRWRRRNCPKASVSSPPTRSSWRNSSRRGSPDTARRKFIRFEKLTAVHRLQPFVAYATKVRRVRFMVRMRDSEVEEAAHEPDARSRRSKRAHSEVSTQPPVT